MKRVLLLVCATALIATTSCVKDEVVKIRESQAIGFRTFVETRGLEANTWTLMSFYVTALETGADTPYFNDLMFMVVGTEDYASSPVYYWPGNERKLEFYAYAPSVADMGDGADVTITHSEKSITGYTVNDDITLQKDLIFAYNNNDGAGLDEVESVPLAFNHLLSKISVNARTDSDYIYNIAGVRLGGAYNKGDIANLYDTVWSTDAYNSKSIYSMTYDDDIVTVQKNEGSMSLLKELPNLNSYGNSNYMFMIPQTITPWDPENDNTNVNKGAYISVRLQINTAEGVRVYPSESDTDGYAWVAVPISEVEWKGGYAYTYYLDFTNGAGYVDPEEEGAGEKVLGDAVIKVTASLPEMNEGVENVVVNPNMIGKWEAYHYYIDRTYYTYNEDDEKVIGETVRTEESKDVDYIGTKIDNFASLEILDGRKIWIKHPVSQEKTWVDYYVNEDNYILVDCYRRDYAEPGSLNTDDYSVTPVINEIYPASEQSKGNADIKVYGSNWEYDDNGDRVYYDDVMTILYTIEII